MSDEDGLCSNVEERRRLCRLRKENDGYAGDAVSV